VPLCNSITRQPIVLESCSKPQRLSNFSVLHSKIFFSVLGFTFFVDDIISEIDLGLFGQGYWALSINHNREVLHKFTGNWAKINLGKIYPRFFYPNFGCFASTFEPETLES